jgi:hypothetical protein
MRLFLALIASILLAACDHVSSAGGDSGSSITPYGVIDSGVTRSTNR